MHSTILHTRIFIRKLSSNHSMYPPELLYVPSEFDGLRFIGSLMELTRQNALCFRGTSLTIDLSAVIWISHFLMRHVSPMNRFCQGKVQ